MQSLSNIHRSIVRAAMAADGCIDVLKLEDIDEHEHKNLVHQIIDSYKLELESE